MKFSFFPAFFDKPEGIRYGQQEPNEVIELMLRRHWVTNLPWIFISLIGFTLPAILISIDQAFNFNVVLQTPPTIIFGALILWYLLILGYVLEQFLYWYYNIYLATNIHLIDVNFFSLLYRDVTEISFKNIEVVTAKLNGIAASLFNFGDVIIETAAEDRSLIFENVPKPDFVADRIDELRMIKVH